MESDGLLNVGYTGAVTPCTAAKFSYVSEPFCVVSEILAPVVCCLYFLCVPTCRTIDVVGHGRTFTNRCNNLHSERRIGIGNNCRCCLFRWIGFSHVVSWFRLLFRDGIIHRAVSSSDLTNRPFKSKVGW